jgi:hypothetical protein
VGEIYIEAVHREAVRTRAAQHEAKAELAALGALGKGVAIPRFCASASHLRGGVMVQVREDSVLWGVLELGAKHWEEVAPQALENHIPRDGRWRLAKVLVARVVQADLQRGLLPDG